MKLCRFLSICLSIFLTSAIEAGSQARSGGGGSPSILIGMSGSGVNFGAESQGFVTFGPDSTKVSSSESERQILVPVSGTLRNLWVRTTSSQQSDAELTLTVKINGTVTALAITIPADSPAGTFFDLTNTVPVIAGDLLSLRGGNFSEVGSSANLVQWSISVE